MRVAAVVPVIDEEDAVGDVVGGLRKAGACCVLVVDGGSRDRTRAAAAEAGALVIDEPRRGYGRACLTGAERALTPTPDGHVHDAVAFLDGDGSCDPADLPALVAGATDADVVLGRRPHRLVAPGAMPWHARAGNRVVAAILSARTGRVTHDVPPFKVLRVETLARLELDDEGYGWTVQLVARSLLEPATRVRELPVQFRVRSGGVSKVSGSLSASLRAGRTMLAMAVRETRPRPVIALMAKAPGPFGAKTRLARELGDERTADLWIACLSDVADALRAAARGSRAGLLTMLPTHDDVGPVAGLIGRDWTPRVQRRPGLSAALAEAFLVAFDAGSDRAVAVAGDAAGLTPSQVMAALGALQQGSSAAVIGPTSDGGYHLVGLRWVAAPRWWPDAVRRRVRRRLARRLDAAFGPVPMGSGSALDVTTQTLRAAGWRVTAVSAWPDMDTLDDLRLLARAQGGEMEWAPRTAAWIAGHQDVIAGQTQSASMGQPPGKGPPEDEDWPAIAASLPREIG